MIDNDRSLGLITSKQVPILKAKHSREVVGRLLEKGVY